MAMTKLEKPRQRICHTSLGFSFMAGRSMRMRAFFSRRKDTAHTAERNWEDGGQSRPLDPHAKARR